ncbi:hypothetical protein [Natronincola ferrireducens]|uniref:Uncharacterized protein n=1 Tax=Natronincola ferrireducens TaxID=393762 RepID=A0A1G9IGQ2_9FIRM|nr:hypothetical protein [Natronincola ferrireducens]SDL24282.1 hypothetical protein SAMN05660472_02864 [Natronincola ferrireducens]
MFKKTIYKNRILLFLTSYIPLYLIIIVQNSSSLWNRVTEILVDKSLSIEEILSSKSSVILSVKGLAYFVETYIIVFFICLSIVILIIMKKMIDGLEEYKEDYFTVTVVDIKNKSHEYIISYFSVYIFPFITINLSTVSGVIQFAIMWGIIGYVYVKNNLIYINPTLNILYKYNIYEAKMEYIDEESNVIFHANILSKKDESMFTSNKEVYVIKESDNLYIEGGGNDN